MTTTLSQVIHCLLIYDVIRKLVETFTERDVEILLLLLKSELVIANTVAKMIVCTCVYFHIPYRYWNGDQKR